MVKHKYSKGLGSDNMGKLNSHSKENVWENTNITKL